MSMTNKKGVDLSSLNGNVDMNKIKDAGFDFVMLRCGFGNDVEYQDDSQFESNVKKAESAGLAWGAYLYSYALNVEDAKSEARHVIRLLKGKKPTMPIAFDMEDADDYKWRNGMPANQTLVDICKTFLGEIKKHGYYPMLYASLSWFDEKLNHGDLIGKYDIWCAQWSSACQYNRANLGMWQYGGETNILESNSIPGIGVIDKNICYKDYPSIIKSGGYNNWDNLNVLDIKGFEKGDETYGVFALKELILIAKKLGIITQGVDENAAFGEGTEIAVNQVLKIGGYAQNGIAGYKLIKHLADLIKKKI